MLKNKYYYVNVSQTLGVLCAGVLAWKAIRLEEAKAGIQHKTIREVVAEDVSRIRDFFGRHTTYRQYRHY